MKPRALVVHTGGGLGDVLLSTPVIDALNDDGYLVDMIARKGTASVLSGHPNLHHLSTIETRDPPTLPAMKRMAQQIREKRYRVALLLWTTTRWAWTLYWSGVPWRVGQDSRLLSSFLFTDPVRVRSEHGDTQTHQTQILLDYVRVLGITPNSVTPFIAIPEDARTKAQRLLVDAPKNWGSGPIIAFHSGKGLPLTVERWPVDHFAKIADHLQRALDARLILTGGPAELEIVESLSAQLGRPHLNVAGKTSLSTLAALAQICDLFICPDSGPMHVAAAAGAKVIGIYALDEDFPDRWAPHCAQRRIVRPPRPACPPGCRKPSCPSFVCYRKVEPELILRAARDLLADEGSPIRGSS